VAQVTLDLLKLQQYKDVRTPGAGSNRFVSMSVSSVSCCPARSARGPARVLARTARVPACPDRGPARPGRTAFMITTVVTTTLLLGDRFLFRGGYYSTSWRPISIPGWALLYFWVANWVQFSIDYHANTPQSGRASIIPTVATTTLLLGGRFLFRGNDYSTSGRPVEWALLYFWVTSWVQCSAN